MQKELADPPTVVKTDLANQPVATLGRMSIVGCMEQKFRQKMLAAWDQPSLTAAELARRAGVTYDVVNKLKRGDVESTSAENARKIAVALGFEWTGESAAGFAETPPAPTYTARVLAAMDQEEPPAGPVKPFEIQFSQVDGVVKVAAVIRDPEGFTKLRATLDALQALTT